MQKIYSLMIGSKKRYTILFTGGTGFLGSSLIKLVLEFHNVVIITRDKKSLKSLEDVRDHLTVYALNEMPDSIDTIFAENEIDIVVHAATLYGKHGENDRTIAEANLNLPLRLFHLGLKYHVKAFFNADTVLDRFINSYALTKAHFRDWLQFYADKTRIINCQLEHFYGPQASHDNFISLMIRQMLDNKDEIALTEGLQERDFVFVDDVVNAFMLLLGKIDSFDNGFYNFQIASGEIVSIRRLLELIHALTGSSSRLNFGVVPYRKNELMKPETNNIALKNLGWQPLVSLQSGLEETINYIKSNT